MTNDISNPPFPTLARPRKIVLHFRFIAQSFISTLSSYVFDTAIGGNFDPFLAQLASSTSFTDTDASTSVEASRFTDAFELASAHSNLLDRILTACLLRSGQKVVADLLGQALDLVLEFCVVVGELQRRRLKEYEAEEMVEGVYAKLRARMATFVSRFRNGWTPPTLILLLRYR